MSERSNAVADVAPAAADSGDWPPVTVVVPTRSRPELLRRAVLGVLGQDYPGTVECLVVFDGTEPDLPYVPVPQRRRLSAATNARTPGLAGTRNTGYGLARGEYLATCDDDDEWLPGKLRAQVRLLHRRPDASVCATGIVIRYRGRDTVRRGPSHDLSLQDFLRDRHAEIHPSSFLFRRDLGLFVDEDLAGGYAEDYEWLLRASRMGPVVAVPDALTVVHWHKASYFANRWEMIERALTDLLQRHPEFASEPGGLARIEGQLAFAHAALGDRREAVRLARRSLRRRPTVRQSYAALLVAGRLVSADRVLDAAHRAGRGI